MGDAWRLDPVAAWAAGNPAEPLGKANADLAARGVELGLRCGPPGTVRQTIEAGARPDIVLSPARAHVDRMVDLGPAREGRRLCGERIVAPVGPAMSAGGGC